MAGICTNSTRKNGPTCDHRTITVNLDGTPVAFDTMQAELDAIDWNEPVPGEWRHLSVRQLFVRLGAAYLGNKGVAVSDFIGRVTNGEEGNNVKIYPIITKDIIKTNMSNAGANTYTNVPIGANGERKFVNFFGHTQFRVRVWANLVGTGPFGFRLIRDSDNEILYENASVALTGERELDPGWLDIPLAFQNQPDGTLLRLQIKSVTATDDPVVRGCDLGVK